MRYAFLVLLALLVACGPPAVPTSVQQDAATTEANQIALKAAMPPPRLTTSLERKNLVRRLERINTENLVSYIYLVSQTGKVMAFYTVDGKITSLNAYLTPDYIQKISSGGGHVLETQLPDYDGAYGKNPDGVFFFTTEGVYVEWFGEYLWSDQPLKLTQQPELIYEVKR
jgi:hypothetical protein